MLRSSISLPTPSRKKLEAAFEISRNVLKVEGSRAFGLLPIYSCRLPAFSSLGIAPSKRTQATHHGVVEGGRT